MITKKNHNLHIVDIRPWPIISSITSIILTLSLIIWFNKNNKLILMIRLLIVTISAIQWWRDVTRESFLQGIHTKTVYLNLKWGIILFILSEIIFFVSFFWAFFQRRLSPTNEVGLKWPPTDIRPFNPIEIPLLNTIILLSSGVTVTWAHHSLINNKKEAIFRLALTVILGIYFRFLQYLEYQDASFNISDSVYGRTFFISTGFHGLHVLIGRLFLMVNLLRAYKSQLSSTHHFSFEASAWYWHFVDVVWLFLYINVYWWGI